jgi:hypothetical protein
MAHEAATFFDSRAICLDMSDAMEFLKGKKGDGEIFSVVRVRSGKGGNLSRKSNCPVRSIPVRSYVSSYAAALAADDYHPIPKQQTQPQPARGREKGPLFAFVNFLWKGLLKVHLFYLVL